MAERRCPADGQRCPFASTAATGDVHLLATTNGGLEAVAAAELAELVGADATVHHRGVVEFEGSVDDVYALLARSRTCHRVLEVLADGRVEDLEGIYDRARGVDLARHLPFADFGVVGTRHGDHGFTSVDVADRVGQAVIDGYREATGDRLPVDLDDPTVRLEAYLYDDRFTLAVDLTGDSLHRRPYRVCTHDAPLRATMAASMLRLASYTSGDRLVDPMAGSGTVPIEAALAATDSPPRPELDPALAALPRYDVATFQDRLAGLDRRDAPPSDLDLDLDLNLNLDLNLEARDRRERWCRCARVNRDAAGLSEVVEVVRADAREATLEADCVVVNLPFGIRVSEDLRELYRTFADRLREGGVDRLVALTTKPEFLPLEPRERYELPYGRLDATILVCEP